MSFYEAYAVAAPSVDWSSEVAARIGDILERRAPSTQPVRERIEQLARLVEQGIQSARPIARVRGSVTRLLERIRTRGRVLDSGEVIDAESQALLEDLFLRIQSHGQEDSIENYGAFLFTVDLDL